MKEIGSNNGEALKLHFENIQSSTDHCALLTISDRNTHNMNYDQYLEKYMSEYVRLNIMSSACIENSGESLTVQIVNRKL